MKGNTTNSQTLKPPPKLTVSQLDEALEERVNSDRRFKSRQRPSAIIERRVNQRRKSDTPE